MSDVYNVGAARYWLGRLDDVHGWILLGATDTKPVSGGWLKVIDRGPINPWTGEPHGT